MTGVAAVSVPSPARSPWFPRSHPSLAHRRRDRLDRHSDDRQPRRRAIGRRAAVAATLIKILRSRFVVLVAIRFGSGHRSRASRQSPRHFRDSGGGSVMLFRDPLRSCGGHRQRNSRFGTDGALATLAGTGFTAVIYLLATVAALMLLPSALAAAAALRSRTRFTILGPRRDHRGADRSVSAFGTANALLLLAAEVGRRSPARAICRPCSAPPTRRRAGWLAAPRRRRAAVLVSPARRKTRGALCLHHPDLDGRRARLYLVCAAAALKLGVIRRWAVIAVIAIVYSLAMFVGAGLEATLWGFALALAGLPIRFISRWLNGSTPAAEASPAAPRE